MSGPVIVKRPVNGATQAQDAQIREYVELSNLAELEGYLSPTGRVSTTGRARANASREAARERARAEAASNPYDGVVGHAPDSTWTGRPSTPFWVDKDWSINSIIGRQARDYPIGYKPTRFIFEEDL